MIDFYFWTTPNGYKILMFLEETGIPYRIMPVNISKGEQFEAEFLRISPNNKMPAIVDHDPEAAGESIAIFESGAILLSPSLVNTGHWLFATLLRQRGVIGIAIGTTTIVGSRVIGVGLCPLAKSLWQIRVGQEQTTECDEIGVALLKPGLGLFPIEATGDDEGAAVFFPHHLHDRCA